MRTWKPRRPVVLIVDDDPDILRVLGLCLSAEGCDVREALSGADALRMLDGVDVIVVDQRMPTMCGTEFVAAARAQGYVGRALSISSSRSARTDAGVVNADSFLAKPIGARELLTEVERLFYLTVPPHCLARRASSVSVVPSKA